MIVTTTMRAEGQSRTEAPGSLCNSHCVARSSSSQLGTAIFS